MLGLAQMLFLSHNARENLATLMQLARDEVQGFPFAVVSLNCTQWALRALRSGALNEEANRRGSVLSALNACYAGELFYLYVVWFEDDKTMADSGYVLKDVSQWVEKNAVAAVDFGGPKTLLSLGARVKAKAAGRTAAARPEDQSLQFSVL